MTSTLDGEALLSEAHRAHDRADWTAAARAYRAVVASGAATAAAWLALGDVESELGDHAAALQCFRTLCALEPGNAVARFRAGTAAFRAGDLATARRELRLGYALASDTADALPSEPLLPTSVSQKALLELDLAGWSTRATALLAATRDGAGADVTDLHLIRASDGGAPQVDLQGVRTLGVLVLDTGSERSGPRLLWLSRLLKSLGRPHATVLFMRGPDATEAAAAIARVAEGLGLPVLALAADGAAHPAALMTLGLALAASLSCDALVSLEGVEGAADWPEVAAAFQSDPLAGFAVPYAKDGASTVLYGCAQLSAVVLIRARVLAETGLPDGVFDDMAAAVLDLMLRANWMGVSTVRIPGPPAGPAAPRSEADARILLLRQPAHRNAVVRFERSPEARASRLAAALTGPRRLLLDLYSLRDWHDGTAELSVRLAEALAGDRRFELHLWCERAAAEHHGLTRFVPGERIVPLGPAPEVYTACFKAVQPGTWRELVTTWSPAPLAGFLMLDPISLDIERLDTNDLRPMFRLALEHSEILGFLSEFTRDQFARRFDLARSDDFISLCSTALDEYPDGSAGGVEVAPSGVLLVGNPYGHKNLRGAVRRLRARWPELHLTVLGMVAPEERGVTWAPSGRLTPAELDSLYAAAEVVVFPSLYEGFGLPIMHALAHRRPVAALDQPVSREIAARCAAGANLHLFSSTEALADGLAEVRAGGFRPADRLVREHRWADAARLVGDAVIRAERRFDLTALRRRCLVSSLVEARL